MGLMQKKASELTPGTVVLGPVGEHYPEPRTIGTTSTLATGDVEIVWQDGTSVFVLEDLQFDVQQ